MKILIESYPYPKDKLEKGLQDIGRERNGKVYFEEVGYYLSNKVRDCVFILPKVLLWQGSDEIDRVFGVYLPEAIVDPSSCKPELAPEFKKFIYGFSTWIYRALAVYRKTNPDNGIVWEKHVPHVGRAGQMRESETLLDVLLSLQDFARENRDFFFFVVKNRHCGLNKINWTRTIARTAAVMGRNGPVYLAPINKKRMINFDEELLVIFYSILNHMREVYGFPVQIDLGYELITGSRFDAYLNEGIGQRRLLAIKYKYFSDRALKLWELCYAFFDNDHRIRVNTDYEEYLQAKDFDRVFEAMIDELIGDRKGRDMPAELTKQDDGKLVDHLYLDRDLTSADEMRKLFYIGDSKYYKLGTPIGKEAYSKQFTYAKNIIQWHLNLFLDKGDLADYAGSHNLRDEVTEGYDVIPNFFISARMSKTLDFDKDELSPTAMAKSEYVSRQFKNRLFDRDTLLIAHYDVNFLFIISLYAQNDSFRKKEWKKVVRRKFREKIQEMLSNNFKFYAMTPKKVGVEKEFLRSDFQKALGRVYKPFKDTGNRPYYVLALDADDPRKDNEDVMKWLAQGFVITKEGQYKLGEDPVGALAPGLAKYTASGEGAPVFGIEAAFIVLKMSDEKKTWRWARKDLLQIKPEEVKSGSPMNAKYVKITDPFKSTIIKEISFKSGGTWMEYVVN